MVSNLWLLNCPVAGVGDFEVTIQFMVSVEPLTGFLLCLLVEIW